MVNSHPTRCVLPLIVLLALLIPATSARAQQQNPFVRGLWAIWPDHDRKPCSGGDLTSSEWDNEIADWQAIHANYFESSVPVFRIDKEDDDHYDCDGDGVLNNAESPKRSYADYQQRLMDSTQSYGFRTTVDANPDATPPASAADGLNHWVYNSHFYHDANGNVTQYWTNIADSIIQNLANKYGGKSGLGDFLVISEHFNMDPNDHPNWPGIHYAINQIHDTNSEYKTAVTNTIHKAIGPNIENFANEFPQLDNFRRSGYRFYDADESRGPTEKRHSTQQCAVEFLASADTDMMDAFMNEDTEWQVIMQTVKEHVQRNERRPTREEVRLQAYLAVARDANGVFSYLYGSYQAPGNADYPSHPVYGLVSRGDPTSQDFDRKRYVASNPDSEEVIDPGGQNAFDNVADTYAELKKIGPTLASLDVQKLVRVGLDPITTEAAPLSNVNVTDNGNTCSNPTFPSPPINERNCREMRNSSYPSRSFESFDYRTGYRFVDATVFEDDEGTPADNTDDVNYVMLVNRLLNCPASSGKGTLTNPREVETTLDDYQIVQNRRTGAIRSGTFDHAGNATTFTASLRPGSGELFELLPTEHRQSGSITSDVSAAGIRAGGSAVIESGEDVTFTAGEEIVLEPGFEVKQGATFEATVTGDAGTEPPSTSMQSAGGAPGVSTAAPAAQSTTEKETLEAASKNDAPERFALHAPYPNPARQQATIGYDVKKRAPVRITVYDVLGRRVTTLVDRERPAGRYRAHFEASRLASGVYVMQARLGERVFTRKIVLQE